jgi:hypothetical protein
MPIDDSLVPTPTIHPVVHVVAVTVDTGKKKEEMNPEIVARQTRRPSLAKPEVGATGCPARNHEEDGHARATAIDYVCTIAVLYSTPARSFVKWD